MGDRVWPTVLTSHLLTHKNLLLFSLLTVFPSLFFSSPFSRLPFSGPISSQINNLTVNFPSLSHFCCLCTQTWYFWCCYLNHTRRTRRCEVVFHILPPQFPTGPQCSPPSMWSGCFSHYFSLNTCKICPSIIFLPTTFSTFSPCKMLHPAVSHGLFS